jgi:dimethylaniline monooxygenase (N-oxide forming)
MVSTKDAKTVAIVGAGSSGLVTAKYMLEYGLLPTIFEKEATVGGLWAKTNNHNAVWDGLRANVSRYFMAFSDLEYPKKSTIFPGKQELYNYFWSYANKFQLEQYVRFNTRVILCSQLEDKRWLVTYSNNGENKSETFDFLVMASGLHEKGRIPACEDQDKFKGTSTNN